MKKNYIFFISYVFLTFMPGGNGSFVFGLLLENCSMALTVCGGNWYFKGETRFYLAVQRTFQIGAS